MNIINTEKIKELIYELLKELGENPDRDGLKETPQRISDMCLELFDNKYSEQDLVKIFEEKRTENNIIEINNISFCSFCEHHLLPFYGTVSIKYLPKNNKILGISKFARIINYFSKKLQLQERLTNQIAEFIYSKISPQAVEVTIEAEHMCMAIRGVKSLGAKTKTTVILGDFKK